MEKDKDKAFAQSELNQIDKDEKRRQEFFDKLHKIQDANDQKHQLYLKYLQTDPAVSAMVKDEQNYIKNMEMQRVKDDLMH